MSTKPLTTKRRYAAWAVAIIVDALQLGLFPATGGLSTFLNIPLDILTMAVLWALVGWHWALIPSCIAEILPFVELVPTWTGAIFIISRSRKTKEIPTLQEGGPDVS